MNERINDFLHDFERNEPMAEATMKKLEAVINFVLPEDYFVFMMDSNGGEGSIGESSICFSTFYRDGLNRSQRMWWKFRRVS